MQILLGARETIIKIHSKSIQIGHIEHFITTHFQTTKVDAHSIYIPQSTHISHHRQFLLKWLYTLYAKRKNEYLPELKNSLIRRQCKAIRIILAKSSVTKVFYELQENQEAIKITMMPKNISLLQALQNFVHADFEESRDYFLCSLKERDVQKQFQKLLFSKEVLSEKYIQFFDKKKMEKYFQAQENSTFSHLLQAHRILGIEGNENKKQIKKQYKNLAKRYHPDKLNSKDEQTILNYTKKFQILHLAYEIVMQNYKQVS